MFFIIGKHTTKKLLMRNNPSCYIDRKKGEPPRFVKFLILYWHTHIVIIFKNGNSRDTGNIGHTRHRTETIKALKHNAILKTKKMIATRTPPKPKSYCLDLASVVCRPFTFHILIFSSETPSAK